MNANELRVGNWVEANSPMMQVKEITEHTVGLYMPGSEADPFLYDIDEINPIPLSPEILHKYGFESLFNSDPQERPASKVYRLGQFTIHQKNEDVNCFEYFSGDYIVNLSALHQLQNLYHALTGEELPHTTTVKPN